jgi:hypothetical protein
MTENKTNSNIETNSDIDESILDINADTPTMNNQLMNHMNNINKSKQNNIPKKILQIDKNMLKTLIVEWLSLDDQIKTYRETIKEMSDEKKQFEEQILELMTALDQEIILTDKGNIIRNVKESKGPLTPELIKLTLTDLLKSPETADVYTNQIMDKRIVKSNIKLKRKDLSNKKKSKSKSKNK